MKEINLTFIGIVIFSCISAQTTISIPGGSASILSNTQNLNIEVKGQVKVSNPGGRSLMLEHENEDNWLTFHDPGDSFFSMGTDRSDGGKFKINFGGSVGANNHLTMDAYGKVGIGTVTPAAPLDIQSNVGLNALRITGGIGAPYYLDLTSYLHSAGSVGYSFSVTNPHNGGTTAPNLLTLFTHGVGIGTTKPDAPLTVKGKIHAEEVLVDLLVQAPDYVFEESYNILPLSEVEAFIKQNKHLPEVPSAKEMEANGLNLKEMNLLLLKKVEELTLHLIEQNKKIEMLEGRNNDLLVRTNVAILKLEQLERCKKD